MNKTIQMISTDELHVDTRYQRPVNLLLVSKIAKHYSEALFSPLLVAERHDREGVYKYVVDGQHRLEAARLLGLKEVPCFVYQGMSPAEEASLFVNQQVATCRLTPRDTYKANVFVGNPENIDVIIDETLHKYGHRIGIHEHDTNGWYAIVALRDTIKSVGQDGLSKILLALNELKWTSGRAAKSRIMLTGLGSAIKSGATITDIVETLSKKYKHPEEFIADATVTARGRKPTVAVVDLMKTLLSEGK